uniref:Uncharacterized protein n=1 Tax=Arundo donax TaxID=35708 RepID=A0A0A9BPQ7_ARUDO
MATSRPASAPTPDCICVAAADGSAPPSWSR